jgi:WD40 repeat protein
MANWDKFPNLTVFLFKASLTIHNSYQLLIPLARSALNGIFLRPSFSTSASTLIIFRHSVTHIKENSFKWICIHSPLVVCSSSSGILDHPLVITPILWERLPQADNRDYSSRFCGHCNTTTDIKEANFFGGDGQYIVAGSDDGKFFIWDRYTTNIVRVLRGDESIVNCLQGHPIAPILATSGIDPVVRLWQPLPQDGCNNERMVEDAATAATNNQRRMNADPFETILLNMGYRMSEDDEGGGRSTEGRSEEDAVQCRPS